MLHFLLVHVLRGDILMHKLKMLLPIILHMIPYHPKNVCKPSSLNLLQETNTAHIPSKQSLNFLLNNGELMKFPLTTILKMVCASMPHSSLHNTIWQYIHPQ